MLILFHLLVWNANKTAFECLLFKLAFYLKTHRYTINKQYFIKKILDLLYLLLSIQAIIHL